MPVPLTLQNVNAATLKIKRDMHDDLLRACASDGQTMLGQTWMVRSITRRWEQQFGQSVAPDYVAAKRNAGLLIMDMLIDEGFTDSYLPPGLYQYHTPRNDEERRGKNIHAPVEGAAPRIHAEEGSAPADCPVCLGSGESLNSDTGYCHECGGTGCRPLPHTPIQQFRVMVDGNQVGQARAVDLPEVSVPARPTDQHFQMTIIDEVTASEPVRPVSARGLVGTARPGPLPQPSIDDATGFLRRMVADELGISPDLLTSVPIQPNPFTEAASRSGRIEEDPIVGTRARPMSLHTEGVLAGIVTGTRMEYLSRNAPIPACPGIIQARLFFNAQRQGASILYMAGYLGDRIKDDAQRIFDEIRRSVQDAGEWMPALNEVQLGVIARENDEKRAQARSLIRLMQAIVDSPPSYERVQRAREDTKAHFEEMLRSPRRNALTLEQVHEEYLRACHTNQVPEEFIRHPLMPTRNIAAQICAELQISDLGNRFVSDPVTLAHLEREFDNVVDHFRSQTNPPSKAALESNFTFRLRIAGVDMRKLDRRAFTHYLSLLAEAARSTFGTLGKEPDHEGLAKDVVNEVSKEMSKLRFDWGDDTQLAEQVHNRLVGLAEARGVSALFQNRKPHLWGAMVQLLGLPLVEDYCNMWKLKLKPHGQRQNRITPDEFASRFNQSKRKIKL